LLAVKVRHAGPQAQEGTCLHSQLHLLLLLRLLLLLLEVWDELVGCCHEDGKPSLQQQSAGRTDRAGRTWNQQGALCFSSAF
jgi:hypothetical protein